MQTWSTFALEHTELTPSFYYQEAWQIYRRHLAASIPTTLNVHTAVADSPRPQLLDTYRNVKTPLTNQNHRRACETAQPAPEIPSTSTAWATRTVAVTKAVVATRVDHRLSSNSSKDGVHKWEVRLKEDVSEHYRPDPIYLIHYEHGSFQLLVL